MGLAWGVFAAGVLQWVFLWPSLVKTGVWSLFSWELHHPGVKKILLLMLPGLFGVSVSQINLLLDTMLATLLPNDGSVGWLYFSDRLTELPLGIIGIAIATVLLPRLSALHSESDHDMFERTLAWAIRIVLLIGLPAMVALVVLPEPLLVLLFNNGEFTSEDVRQASYSLMAYAAGLPAFMLIKILAPAFFSRQNTKTPVKIGIQAMVWNMVFNLLLIVPLAHVGLAAATSLSAWLNASLLAWHLHKDSHLPRMSSLLPTISRTVIASLIMGGLLWYLRELPALMMPDDIFGRIWVVSVLVVSGLVIYAASVLAVGVRIRDLKHP
jgi:putative peptidoglycan lipid II flippase